MKFDDMQALQESVLERGLILAESENWRDYTCALREGYKEKNGIAVPENIVSTTAILLENTREYMARMDETTRVVNMGNFVDYGFDVITATVPNLIAHDLVSVQPLNAKHGAIFYLNYLYASNKGTIKSGDIMNSPFTGTTADVNFSNDMVVGESVGSGDGVVKEFKTTLMYTPVREGTVMVTVATTTPVLLSDDGKGALTSETSGWSGTIDYATGAIDVDTTGTAPASGKAVTVDYRYNMDLTEVGFPQVDLDLKSVSIEAFPRKIRARWLLDAAFELQKTKGIDAESELVVALSSEIKHEIDGELLNDMYKLAAHTGYSWSCKMPSGYNAYIDYKRTIIDLFTEMSNKIFSTTKRIGANFIVAGVDVCSILETLPEFVAAGLSQGQINGPHFIGTLAGKWRVYKNPFYAATNFILGYKGTSYLDAGFVYAPYMPLYATPTQVLDDFIFRKGLATSYATKMLNNQLYAKGSITDFTSTRFTPAA